MSNKLFDIWKNTKYYSVKHRNYFDIYQEIFSQYVNKKIIFVEIGVLAGGSLFMWREFFGNDARIIGIDYNPSAEKWKKHGFEIYIGDQGSKKFWKNFFSEVGNVDIILDDGSHTYKDQIVTVLECIPHININGKMVTEDVHSSYQKKYGYPSKYNFVNFSKSLIDQINYRFTDLEKKEKHFTSHLRKKIYSMIFYESVICFNINEEKCTENPMVKNEGINDGAFHMWNYLEKSRTKKILVYLSKKLSFLKKYKIFMFLVNKFHIYLDLKLRMKLNRTSKKYFK